MTSANITPIAAGKQTPHRLRRAAQILLAAREMFLDKGFEGASVAEIAARAGIVEGLVYTYFPTKRDLLDEVMRGMYLPLIHDIESGFARLRGLHSRMRFLVWRHVRVYVEEPGLSRIVLHEVRTRPEYAKSVLHELQVRYTSFLMRTIAEAEADGELPAGTDAEMVRSLVYGGIEHLMWGTLFGRASVDVEVTADAYTNMVLRGIVPAGSDPKKQPNQQRPDDVSGASSADIELRLARLERLIVAQGDPVPAQSKSKPKSDSDSDSDSDSGVELKSKPKPKRRTRGAVR